MIKVCHFVNLITGTETWRYAALANALWVDENNFVISSYSVQLFTGTYLYRIGIDNRNIETLLLSDEELTNPSVYNGIYFIH